jgi:hypothetical protein
MRSRLQMLMVMWVVFMVLPGCLSRYALDQKPVKQMSEAERRSRGPGAFERARERASEVRKGMSMAEVQVVMGAVIAVEEARDGEKIEQRKLMDGFLCRTNPSALKERWLFGYDEGNVMLVGLAIEFVRDDPDDDDWVVRGVDRSPQDDCPIVGDTHLE